MLWAQISANGRAQLEKQFWESREFANQEFFEWIKNNYGSLFNYPPSSPLMVNHIQGFINYLLSTHVCERAAFILIDGLAIDQWLLLKDSLKAQGLTAAIEDSAL